MYIYAYVALSRDQTWPEVKFLRVLVSLDLRVSFPYLSYQITFYNRSLRTILVFPYAKATTIYITGTLYKPAPGIDNNIYCMWLTNLEGV